MKLEPLEKDHFYHIYNRGTNRSNIFSNEENKRYFLQLHEKYIGQEVSTFAYCLLNNHFHVVIRVDSDPEEVTQSFSNLFKPTLKHLIKQKTEPVAYLKNILKE